MRIFVASPSDVLDERNRLAEVIDEVNSVLARDTGVRLELLRYEKEVSPDFGEDAQDVINRQIPQDYDIFVGIMWHSVGTSTKRAESGTIEEYQLAKVRFDQDPHSVRLMLYFKDAGPSLSDINPEQLGRVKDFRKRVNDEGAFYATFITTDDFAKQARQHLMKLVLNWDSQPEVTIDVSLDSVISTKSQPTEQFDDEQEPDDEGIIDLEEIIEEEMASLATVLNKMSNSIEEIGDSTNLRVADVNAPASQNKGKLEDKERRMKRTELKRITRDTSGDMKRFVRKMNEDIPSFKHHFNRSLNTLAKAIPIYKEFNEDVTELKEGVTALLEANNNMLEGMEQFHNSVIGLPKLSTELARSKKEMGRTLQLIINVTKDGITSLEVLDSMLVNDN